MTYVVPQTRAWDAFDGVRSYLASVYREDKFVEIPGEIALAVFDPGWDADMSECQIKLQAEWKSGVISMRNYNVNGGRDLIIVYPEPGAEITATSEHIDIKGRIFVREEEPGTLLVQASPDTIRRIVTLTRL